MNENMLSIKDVCVELGLSEVYVRRMIQHGKIATTQVEIAKNTYKHYITREEVERWRKAVGNRTIRQDGRSKFNLYATAEEIEKLQALLAESNIETPIIRANKVKEV